MNESLPNFPFRWDSLKRGIAVFSRAGESDKNRQHQQYIHDSPSDFPRDLSWYIITVSGGSTKTYRAPGEVRTHNLRISFSATCTAL